MGLIKPAGATVILACAAVLNAGAPASAEVTIGQVAPSGGALLACDTAATDLLQPSVTAGGNLYSARAAGTITSWSIRTASAGDNYTLKIFRRTTDPDIFRVTGHSGPHSPSSAGLNTFPAQLAVSSGDLIGLNASGMANNCRFGSIGDFVLRSVPPGSLPDGALGNFPPTSAFSDSRLNLSATLVPTNAFSVGRITRDRHKGTATLEILVSNPGAVTLAGAGLKAKRATKTVAVPGVVRFAIAVTGKRKKKLNRKGRVNLRLTTTFIPTGGDPLPQTLELKLKKRLL
jgi:hypothetical protein